MEVISTLVAAPTATLSERRTELSYCVRVIPPLHCMTSNTCCCVGVSTLLIRLMFCDCHTLVIFETFSCGELSSCIGCLRFKLPE